MIDVISPEPFAFLVKSLRTTPFALRDRRLSLIKLLQPSRLMQANAKIRLPRLLRLHQRSTGYSSDVVERHDEPWNLNSRLVWTFQSCRRLGPRAPRSRFRDSLRMWRRLRLISWSLSRIRRGRRCKCLANTTKPFPTTANSLGACGPTTRSQSITQDTTHHRGLLLHRAHR